MKAIDEIIDEVGELTVGRWREQAKRNYTKMDNRDLSRGEYVNCFIRHAYACVQQAKSCSEGAD